LIYVTATVIIETVIQSSKTMENGRFKNFWKIRIQKQMEKRLVHSH
jgi:hypothetical protein